jgi:uncharacterized membrane protein YoaK (UPF0700 family)
VHLFKRAALFRTMVILPWILPFLSISGFPRITFEGFTPSERLSYLLHVPSWYVIGAVTSFVLSVATTIGCWLFWRWARAAYLPVAIMYLVFAPLGMVYTSAMWDHVLFYVAAAAQGAVVAMAFSPPIAEKFTRPRTSK